MSSGLLTRAARERRPRSFPSTGVVNKRRPNMSGGVYKVIELVGTSTDSWEAAARAAIEAAAHTIQDIRVAEVVKMDVRTEANEIVEFRTKVLVSFKYHKELSD
jgi:flavin-binding protein dodecin